MVLEVAEITNHYDFRTITIKFPYALTIGSTRLIHWTVPHAGATQILVDSIHSALSGHDHQQFSGILGRGESTVAGQTVSTVGGGTAGNGSGTAVQSAGIQSGYPTGDPTYTFNPVSQASTAIYGHQGQGQVGHGPYHQPGGTVGVSQ